MRLLFLILVLLNAVAFGYIRFAESRAGADNQLSLLQIAPEKMKLVKPAASTLPRNDTSRAQPTLVCLEWGGFAVEEFAKAGAALDKAGVTDKVSQRETGESYWVYIPSLKTRADADKKAAELRARGVTEFAVMPDTDRWPFALSLGVFKTEESANNYLAQLQQKGVRSIVAGPRGARSVTFVIRDPGDAAAEKIAALKAEFPAAQLKVTTCADALTAKN
jgi:cell division protein FtsN